MENVKKLKKQERYNLNRGYQKLRVWQDAIFLNTMILEEFKGSPFEFKKMAGQQIAAADSIHRNIAEGYCRRSIREYIQFLYVALASLGETVSGLVASKAAHLISEDQFETLDSLCYKLENGLISLVRSLEKKRNAGDWVDYMVKEESFEYAGMEEWTEGVAEK